MPLGPSSQVSSPTSPPHRRWQRIVVTVAVLAVGCALSFLWFKDRPDSPKSIQLTAADVPAHKGWQIATDPFWVHAKAVKPLPKEGRFREQFVVVVFKDEEPFYVRMIDVADLEKGHTFDFALKKTGQSYTAAFVELEKSRSGRKISNTLAFTH